MIVEWVVGWLLDGWLGCSVGRLVFFYGWVYYEWVSDRWVVCDGLVIWLAIRLVIGLVIGLMICFLIG